MLVASANSYLFSRVNHASCEGCPFEGILLPSSSVREGASRPGSFPIHWLRLKLFFNWWFFVCRSSSSSESSVSVTSVRCGVSSTPLPRSARPPESSLPSRIRFEFYSLRNFISNKHQSFDINWRYCFIFVAFLTWIHRTIVWWGF